MYAVDAHSGSTSGHVATGFSIGQQYCLPVKVWGARVHKIACRAGGQEWTAEQILLMQTKVSRKQAGLGFSYGQESRFI